MTEHWTTILAAVIAGLGGIGGALLWLVRLFATREGAAVAQTITVLQTGAAENRVEAQRNRDAEAVQQAQTQRLIDGQAAMTRALEGVDRRLERIENKDGRGRSGQLPAVNRENR